MSTPQDPGRAPASPGLTSLPRLDDLRQAPGGGYDTDSVREAFDALRRHAAQLQAQLRVLQAAGRTSAVEPSGHAVRMDSLHLIRSAAEFADTLERDAQQASANQLARTEEEVRGRQRELQEREAEIERYREESERQRNEIVNAARNEARELLQNSQRDATREVQEAEARAARLLEQARHQATELTNAARAEVEQTLEWARAQAATIMARAQQGAEQFLASAGLGQDQIGRVADAIVRGLDQPEGARAPGAMPSAAPSPPSAALAGAATTQEPPTEAERSEPQVPPVSQPPVSAPPPTSPAADAGPASSDDEGERDEPRP